MKTDEFQLQESYCLSMNRPTFVQVSCPAYVEENEVIVYEWGRKRFAICIMENPVIGREGLRSTYKGESENVQRK